MGIHSVAIKAYDKEFQSYKNTPVNSDGYYVSEDEVFYSSDSGELYIYTV